MNDRVVIPEGITPPERFTQDQLGWVPWLEPVAEDELTEYQYEALVSRGRAKNEYFRLLARDPEILRERTKTDNDIFYNTKQGLPRADREIAATATSRLNGCVFCASVHSGFASFHSKRPDDVQRLLDEGPGSAQDPRWRAIIDAAVALAQTPPAFGPEHVQAMRDAGMDDLEIQDAIQGAAFFNWANRLMLSLGEPTA